MKNRLSIQQDYATKAVITPKEKLKRLTEKSKLQKQ